jgi:hypothetical protein
MIDLAVDAAIANALCQFEPVSFGISISVTRMSGLSRSISVHASSPFAALPMTSRSDSSRSSADSAPRTIA